MTDDDDFQDVRCVCGEWVVAIHAECRAMLTSEEYLQFNKRGFIRWSDDR